MQKQAVLPYSCCTAACGEAQKVVVIGVLEYSFHNLIVLQLTQVVFIMSHAVVGSSEIQLEFEGISLDNCKL